ncbi:MAG: hypothetical protein PHR78_01690 [Eubacteriales bacterium]|nr:hypothetical protein [Eubacteriales bacterium]MDD4323234.1 hypothetical protein [Eubacteriales bacterium]MDD4540868.1 hypothetical protein [Eubacteriales bacterium]
MDELNWKIRIPLLKNRLIRNQLALAIGIPFGILCLVLLLLQAYNGLALVGATLVLAFLLVLFIFRGTYDVEFTLDEQGISCETQNKQKKRVRRMASATAVMGVLAGNPTATGAGLMAGARTNERLLWKRIRKVKYLDQQRTIMLRAGWGEAIAVFCTEENYQEISAAIQQNLGT